MGRRATAELEPEELAEAPTHPLRAAGWSAADALFRAAQLTLGVPRGKQVRATVLARNWEGRKLRRLEAESARLAAIEAKRLATRKAKRDAHLAGLVWRPDYMGGPCRREDLPGRGKVG